MSKKHKLEETIDVSNVTENTLFLVTFNNLKTRNYGRRISVDVCVNSNKEVTFAKFFDGYGFPYVIKPHQHKITWSFEDYTFIIHIVRD